MEQSLSEGSQTFEQALYRLYRDGEIELDEALRNADSATNLSWMINNAQTVEERERNIQSKVLDDTTPQKPEDSQSNSGLMFDMSLH
jgi:twitching motility protein PilU